MSAFRDINGVEWTILVTVGAVMRVREGAGVDLLDATTGQTFLELANDPIKLVGVLWVLVSDQAAARNVDAEAFAELLGGESLEGAVRAFVEGVTAFFGSPGQREALTRAAAKSDEVRDHLTKIAGDRMEAIDPKALAERIAKEESPPETPSG